MPSPSPVSLDSLAHIFSFLSPHTLLNTLVLISNDVYTLITYKPSPHNDSNSSLSANVHLSNFIWKCSIKHLYNYLPQDEPSIAAILTEKQWNWLDLFKFLLTKQVHVSLWSHEILTKCVMERIESYFGNDHPATLDLQPGQEVGARDDNNEEHAEDEAGETVSKTFHIPLLKAIQRKFKVQSEFDIVIDLGQQDVSKAPSESTNQYSLILLNDDNTHIIAVIQQVREATKLDIMQTILKVHEAHHKGFCILATTSTLRECEKMTEILNRVGLQTRIVDFTPNTYERLYRIFARAREIPHTEKTWTVDYHVTGSLLIFNTGNFRHDVADHIVEVCHMSNARANLIADSFREWGFCSLATGNFGEIQRIYQGMIDKEYSVMFHHQ
uniref:Adaptor protein ClpS core domain-containing protein n=1 Tax=Percolomonas cosmopolitus TaxID=63605 RepID=A0A7S1KPJ0_9EUKA